MVSASFVPLIRSAVVPHSPADSLGGAPVAAQAKVPLVAEPAVGDGDDDADLSGSEEFCFGTSRAEFLLSADEEERTDLQSS